MTDAKTECPVCSFSDRKERFEQIDYPALDHQQAPDIPSVILVCPDCETGFAWPMPSDNSLAGLYENSEYWGNSIPPISDRSYPIPFSLAEERWRLISARLKKEKKEAQLSILDVGAGQGCLGLVARRNLDTSFCYSVVEPDLQMNKGLKRAWGSNGSAVLKVYNTLSEVSETYDVIVMSHVLEHATDPVGFLRNVSNYLNRDGFLFIDVPNCDFFYKTDVFPHLLFFSPRSMRHLLDHSNLMSIDVKEWGRNRESMLVNANTTGLLKTGFRLFDRFFYRILNGIPISLYKLYYKWYFGMGRQQPNGLWIRAFVELERSK